MSSGPLSDSGIDQKVRAQAHLQHEEIRPTSRIGPLSWALFDWGHNPYTILIVIFVFSPYFTNVVVGDPVEGQAIWGYIKALAAIVVALLAPILGAIADRGGARKPWLAVLVALMVPPLVALWYAMPDGQGLSIPVITGLIILCTLAYEFAKVFYNAMLPTLVPENRLGGLSGLGLALGNAGAVLLMLLMLYAFALPGQIDAAFLPSEPLFGINQETYEHNRISGPLVGVWLVIFTLPFFLFTPDVPRVRHTMGAAVREGLASLRTTFRRASHYRNVMLFLLGRMIYNDGKTAILIFGGVYAAGIFDWNVIDLLVYGIVLQTFAIGGGLLGGWLDDRFGSKTAVVTSIGVTMVGLVLAISITPTTVFFVPIANADEVIWAAPILNTVPELAYMAVGTILAMAITAAYSSSRVFLARLAPRDMMSEFFGLYALSGTATSFAGPLLVAVVTDVFQSQRAGFLSVLALLAVGLVIVLYVREERAERAT